MSRISRLSPAVGLGLAVLMLAASDVAGAQYSYSVRVGSTGPVDCINSQNNTSQYVRIPYPITNTYTLPAPPNNVVYFLYLNGALQGKEFDTESPPSGSYTDPNGDIFWDTPASPPFTVVARGFPALNGSPIGTGFEYRVQCNSLGVGTGIGTLSVLQAPVTPPAPDVNQHGLTGSWYEPATSGQGIEVEVFPNSSSGTGATFVSWFTYDTVIGGAERQRWYTAQGPMVTGQPYAPLTIYRNTGGNFNAPPVINAQVVGNATLSFDSCSSGQLSYEFTDGTGRAGNILLTRLTQNVTCTTTTARPTNADFALSGNWYDPATSGQGLTVEVNPNHGAFFAAWYTYVPNGAGAGVAGQRWYTAQAAFTAGLRSIPVTIYETTGGVFDQPTPPGQKTVPVGTGTMAFQSCSAATFSYNFTGGSSSGASGTIALRRVGPVPPGCTTEPTQPACAEIGGKWNVTEDFGYTCNGSFGSGTTTQSGTFNVTITQTGCNISFPSPIGTADTIRTGSVSGNTFQAYGPLSTASAGYLLSQNRIDFSGTVANDERRIDTTGVGTVSGTYQGSPGTCTASSKETWTR